MYFLLLQVEQFNEMLSLTVGLTVDGYLLNVAISLCLFENPCRSWKEILGEETLSMT